MSILNMTDINNAAIWTEKNCSLNVGERTDMGLKKSAFKLHGVEVNFVYILFRSQHKHAIPLLKRKKKTLFQ